MTSSHSPLVTLIPAIKGEVGTLETFQAQIRPNDIRPILGYDPRHNSINPQLQTMYKSLNHDNGQKRRLSEYVKTNLTETMGVLPSIAIGISQPCVFNEFPDTQGIAGQLNLELAETNIRVLLNGLEIMEAVMDSMNMEKIDSVTFPVTFFAPKEEILTLGELRQLFYNFQFLQNDIPVSLYKRFDLSDQYVQLTGDLGTSATVNFYGRMEENSQGLGGKSTCLVAQRVLLRFVRGACEGRAFQASSQKHSVNNPNLTPDTQKDILVNLEYFIGSIAKHMGVEQFKNHDYVHLTASGWQTLGLVFHELYFTRKERIGSSTYEDVIRRIGEIDWSRDNPDWLGIVLSYRKGIDKPVMNKAGGTTIMNMLEYVRKETGLI